MDVKAGYLGFPSTMGKITAPGWVAIAQLWWASPAQSILPVPLGLPLWVQEAVNLKPTTGRWSTSHTKRNKEGEKCNENETTIGPCEIMFIRSPSIYMIRGLSNSLAGVLNDHYNQLKPPSKAHVSDFIQIVSPGGTPFVEQKGRSPCCWWRRRTIGDSAAPKEEWCKENETTVRFSN